MKKILILSVGATIILASCKVIRPGQAGVKQKLGKLSTEVKTQGNILFNPFTSKVIIASIQTNNLELNLSLPSKEGLSVNSEISILRKFLSGYIFFISGVSKQCNMLTSKLLM